MSTKESYSAGSVYENFIRRAHGSNDRTKNGANSAYMTNLIDRENGESWVSHLPSADKQLEKVRVYLIKALEKIRKWPLSESEATSVDRAMIEVLEATHSRALMEVINSCFDSVKALRPS